MCGFHEEHAWFPKQRSARQSRNYESRGGWRLVACTSPILGVGLWLGKSSRCDSHLVFDDEVIQVRTVKRMPEERRWQAGRVVRLPWLSRPTRVKERVAQRRRRHITWNYIRKKVELRGARRPQLTRLTTTSSALNASRGLRCRERMQKQQEWQEQEPRSAGRRVSRQVPAVETPQQWCLLQQLRRRLQIHPSETGLQHAKQTLLPRRTWEVRQSFTSRDSTPSRTVEAVPGSKKTRHIAGLQFCAVDIIPNDWHAEEPDIEHIERSGRQGTMRSQSTWPWSLLLERCLTRERDPACGWTRSMSGSDGIRSLTVCTGIETSRKYPTAKRRHMCRADRGLSEVPFLLEPLRGKAAQNQCP